VFNTSLNHFKSVFTHKFFVAPADRNYFLARFAKTYGMNEEFWWQSLLKWSGFSEQVCV